MRCEHRRGRWCLKHSVKLDPIDDPRCAFCTMYQHELELEREERKEGSS
ncbi:MAG: hypothetical protein QXU62_02875 [Thermofilaceae archaeon]